MAANTLMRLLVSLGVDSGDLDKGLGDAEKKSSGFASNVTKILGGTGLAIAGAVTAAAGATVAFLGSTIAPASDLAESINAVNVVFEDGAKTIQEYGKTAATTVGLSNREFNQLSSVTGAFLTNLGYDSQSAADETIVLTERAADMASVFNTDVGTALAAIQSGLKGEFNPLEQFGVKMNAAAIEAYALENGLAASKDGLTDNIKAQAALALLMEQTDKVAGDFQNTSDGMANSQRQLGAMWEDLKAQIGAGLLPAVESLMNTFKEIAATPEFQAFLDGVIKAIADLGMWLVATIPVVIQKFGELKAWFESEGSPAIGGAIANIVSFVQNLWAKIQEGWAAIQPALAAFGSFWTGTLMPAVQAVWGWMSETLFPFFQALGIFLGVLIKKDIEAFSAIWKVVLLPALTAVYEFLDKYVFPIFRAIGSFVADRMIVWFKSLSDTLGLVTGWIGKLTSGLNSITLPDWLTPGSPTPFEMGLWGIQDALQAVSRTGLPNLNAGLQLSPVGAVSGIATPTGEQATQPSGTGVMSDFDMQRLADIITRAEVAAWQKAGVRK